MAAHHGELLLECIQGVLRELLGTALAGVEVGEPVPNSREVLAEDTPFGVVDPLVDVSARSAFAGDLLPVEAVEGALEAAICSG